MINQLVRKARKMLKTAASAKNVRNDYYFSRIYFKRMLQFFKAFNEADDNAALNQTETLINPLGLQFGATINEAKKALGKDKYGFTNQNGTHTVLFYRRSFNELSLLVQLQFHNNHLFFIGLDVIRRLINEEEKADIVNSVLQTYLHQPYTPGQPYPVIKDAHNNLIIINDDINFSICYLPGNLCKQQQENIEKAMEGVMAENVEKRSMFFAF